MSTDPFAIFETPKRAAKSSENATAFDDNANGNSDLLIPEFSGAPVQARPSATRASERSQDSEVLFDADLESNDKDDDFGDFETAEAERSHGADDISKSPGPGITQRSSGGSSNLVDFGESLGSVTIVPQTPPSRPLGEVFADISDTVSGNATPDARPSGFHVQVQKASEVGDAIEDEWEPFEDGLVAEAPDGKGPPVKLPATVYGQKPVPNDEPRPNNIPPPVILLGVLPQIFQQLKSEEQTTSTEKHKLISQAYNVSAYLIAGRSLRWKRDIILSQSMKIGPAAASKKGGGMKLASIDKSENLKEEREVGEAVHIWQQLSHSFHRSFAQTASQVAPMPLSTNIKVQTLKTGSVMGSSHACALCGLKRDERLMGAASEIEDSFGEFWIEQWGHRDCRDFWSRYKNLLQSR